MSFQPCSTTDTTSTHNNNQPIGSNLVTNNDHNINNDLQNMVQNQDDLYSHAKTHHTVHPTIPTTSSLMSEQPIGLSKTVTKGLYARTQHTRTTSHCSSGSGVYQSGSVMIHGAKPNPTANSQQSTILPLNPDIPSNTPSTSISTNTIKTNTDIVNTNDLGIINEPTLQLNQNTNSTTTTTTTTTTPKNSTHNRKPTLHIQSTDPSANMMIVQHSNMNMNNRVCTSVQHPVPLIHPNGAIATDFTMNDQDCNRDNGGGGGAGEQEPMFTFGGAVNFPSHQNPPHNAPFLTLDTDIDNNNNINGPKIESKAITPTNYDNNNPNSKKARKEPIELPYTQATKPAPFALYGSNVPITTTTTRTATSSSSSSSSNPADPNALNSLGLTLPNNFAHNLATQNSFAQSTNIIPPQQNNTKNIPQITQPLQTNTQNNNGQVTLPKTTLNPAQMAVYTPNTNNNIATLSSPQPTQGLIQQQQQQQQQQHFSSTDLHTQINQNVSPQTQFPHHFHSTSNTPGLPMKTMDPTIIPTPTTNTQPTTPAQTINHIVNRFETLDIDTIQRQQSTSSMTSNSSSTQVSVHASGRVSGQLTAQMFALLPQANNNNNPQNMTNNNNINTNNNTNVNNPQRPTLHHSRQISQQISPRGQQQVHVHRANHVQPSYITTQPTIPVHYAMNQQQQQQQPQQFMANQNTMMNPAINSAALSQYGGSHNGSQSNLPLATTTGSQFGGSQFQWFNNGNQVQVGMLQHPTTQQQSTTPQQLPNQNGMIPSSRQPQHLSLNQSVLPSQRSDLSAGSLQQDGRLSGMYHNEERLSGIYNNDGRLSGTISNINNFNNLPSPASAYGSTNNIGTTNTSTLSGILGALSTVAGSTGGIVHNNNNNINNNGLSILTPIEPTKSVHPSNEGTINSSKNTAFSVVGSLPSNDANRQMQPIQQNNQQGGPLYTFAQQPYLPPSTTASATISPNQNGGNINNNVPVELQVEIMPWDDTEHVEAQETMFTLRLNDINRRDLKNNPIDANGKPLHTNTKGEPQHIGNKSHFLLDSDDDETNQHRRPSSRNGSSSNLLRTAPRPDPTDQNAMRSNNNSNGLSWNSSGSSLSQSGLQLPLLGANSNISNHNNNNDGNFMSDTRSTNGDITKRSPAPSTLITSPSGTTFFQSHYRNSIVDPNTASQPPVLEKGPRIHINSPFIPQSTSGLSSTSQLLPTQQGNQQQQQSLSGSLQASRHSLSPAPAPIIVGTSSSSLVNPAQNNTNNINNNQKNNLPTMRSGLTTLSGNNSGSASSSIQRIPLTRKTSTPRNATTVVDIDNSHSFNQQYALLSSNSNPSNITNAIMQSISGGVSGLDPNTSTIASQNLPTPTTMRRGGSGIAQSPNGRQIIFHEGGFPRKRADEQPPGNNKRHQQNNNMNDITDEQMVQLPPAISQPVVHYSDGTYTTQNPQQQFTQNMLLQQQQQQQRFNQTFQPQQNQQLFQPPQQSAVLPPPSSQQSGQGILPYKQPHPQQHQQGSTPVQQQYYQQSLSTSSSTQQQQQPQQLIQNPNLTPFQSQQQQLAPSTLQNGSHLIAAAPPGPQLVALQRLHQQVRPLPGDISQNQYGQLPYPHNQTQVHHHHHHHHGNHHHHTNQQTYMFVTPQPQQQPQQEHQQPVDITTNSDTPQQQQQQQQQKPASTATPSQKVVIPNTRPPTHNRSLRSSTRSSARNAAAPVPPPYITPTSATTTYTPPVPRGRTGTLPPPRQNSLATVLKPPEKIHFDANGQPLTQPAASQHGQRRLPAIGLGHHKHNTSGLSEDVILQIRNERKLLKKRRDRKKARAGCNCSKSQCLKRYCICFGSGRACTENCNCCSDCLNKENRTEDDDDDEFGYEFDNHKGHAHHHNHKKSHNHNEETEMVNFSRHQSTHDIILNDDINMVNPQGNDDYSDDGRETITGSSALLTERDIKRQEAAQKREEIKASRQAPNEHNVSCNCTKSNCLKQYCACFRYGFACLPSCRCFECKNNKDPWFIPKPQ